MSKKSNKWFIKVRNSYLPKNFIGLLIYLIYLTYLLALIVGWYFHGHNAWDLLVYIIPLSVASAILTQYIASKNS